MLFVKEAYKRGVRLGRDCNYIPYCYYDNEEDLALVNQVIEIPQPDSPPHCGPIVDITPDFMASSCFGAYELVDCSQFYNYSELTYYLLHQCVIPKFKKNNTGKCKTCDKHQLMQCQGGCLSFTEKQL